MQVLTSGTDSSLRVWDLCGKTGLRDFLLCDHTIRVRDAKGNPTNRFDYKKFVKRVDAVEVA